MNAENFATYLKNPTQLYQISYQELKSLVLEYPYCQNLRYLLLLKSQIDQNSDFDKNLQKAATYSFDRSFLFKQFKSAPSPLSPVTEESYQVTEDVLELDQIEIAPNEVIEQEMMQVLQSRHEEEQQEEEMILGSASTDEEFELDLEDLQLASTPDPVALLEEEPVTTIEEKIVATEEIDEEVESAFEISERLAQHLASIQLITKGWEWDIPQKEEVEEIIIKEETKPAPAPIAKLKGARPTPKKAFGSKPKGKAKIKLEEVAGTDKKKKKKKKNKVVEFAERSVKDNAGNASETLAYLLTEQGFYDKAIEIYQRLILLSPKNSKQYLERIEELKSKL
jgi:tetratricopeptide (TPR) repeat protein